MNSLGHLNPAMCFARLRILVSVLSALCVLCASSFAQEWKTVADGVEYAQATMFLDGKVVNRPSDKEGERKIGDAILVTLRNKRKR